MSAITLLHTNDLHNHFSEHQASYLHERRTALGDHGLLLDSGDAISAGNAGFRPGGEPVLDLMSHAGYDAMTVGHREFHFSAAGFKSKLSEADFPVLCANVRSRSHDLKLPVVPFITRQVGEYRVTILGLTVPMITERMLVRKISAWVFDDPITTAKKLIPELASQCDLLVCLTHVGLSQDRLLSKAVNGINLIIGGHTHAVLEQGEKVENTLIVQAGWWGKLLGVVEAEKTPDGWNFTAHHESL